MCLGHSGSSSAAETRSANTRGRVAGTADTQQHQSQVGRRIFRRGQGLNLLLDCQRNGRRQGAHRDIPASRGDPQREHGRTPLGLRNCSGIWRTKICVCFFFAYTVCAIVFSAYYYSAVRLRQHLVKVKTGGCSSAFKAPTFAFCIVTSQTLVFQVSLHLEHHSAVRNSWAS